MHGKLQPPRVVQVWNKTRQIEIAARVGAADTSSTRRRGLLGRSGLADGEGLWIVPCESVHMFGMRFPIDVIYLDRHQRVRKLRPNLRPWRISACLLAHSVLELSTGSIERSGTRVGDQLELRNAAKDSGSSAIVF